MNYKINILLMGFLMMMKMILNLNF